MTVRTIVHSVVKKFQTILTRLSLSKKAIGKNRIMTEKQNIRPDQNEIDDMLKSISIVQPMMDYKGPTMRYSYKDKNENQKWRIF